MKSAFDIHSYMFFFARKIIGHRRSSGFVKYSFFCFAICCSCINVTKILDQLRGLFFNIWIINIVSKYLYILVYIKKIHVDIKIITTRQLCGRNLTCYIYSNIIFLVFLLNQLYIQYITRQKDYFLFSFVYYQSEFDWFKIKSAIDIHICFFRLKNYWT
jgi:hypothetical protein